MANELSDFLKISENLKRLYPTLPNRAATIAVNFTKERFRAQNWLDRVAEPWPKRKNKRRRKGRKSNSGAILVLTGRLRRAPRKESVNAERAIIGIDVPYAQVHNDGLKVIATANVGRYGVRQFTRTRKVKGRRKKRETVKAHMVKAHKRRMNYKMPQRRFIGPSAVLDSRIEKDFTDQIIKATKL